MVLADCEQSWCGHGTSSDVEQEDTADVVREVYADGEFSGSVNQRNHSPQQTRNEEVVGKNREPAACLRLRVEEVRQGEYHSRQERQKDAVGPNEACALHDISPEEKLLGGGLDRGKNQCDRDEEDEAREVGIEGEAVGVEEVLSQPTYQAEWHEPRHEPVTDTVPAYLLPRRDQCQGMTTVDEGDGDENPAEKEREPHHDHQEAPHGTEPGEIRPTERRETLLSVKRERHERASDAADNQPRNEYD